MLQQESAFDTLQENVQESGPKIIPNRLFRKQDFRLHDLKGKSEISGDFFCSFKYSIEDRSFKDSEIHKFKSLFFEFVNLNKEDDKYNEGQKCRLSDTFIIIKFSDKTPDEFLLERHSIIEDTLRRGVQLKKEIFHIIGCSNSQVSEKTFIFMKGTRDSCDAYMEKLIPKIRRLEEKKGVAKRTKYVGLLFTGCQFIVDLPEFKLELLPDKQINKYNFTDGCGLISYKLAQEIYQKNTELQRKWKRQIPSIWQIRYYGKGCVCKGVLVVDHSEREQCVLKMRKSMLKINDMGETIASRSLCKKLGIVNTSANSKIGKLNKQIVALLSVNVDKNVLVSMQTKEYENIRNIRTDPYAAFRRATVDGQWSIMLKLLQKFSLLKDTAIPNAYISLIRNIEPSKHPKRDEKLQLPIPSSRLLYGASIPEHLPKLIEGQCIVMTEKGHIEGSVIVCRSPSYFPGDIVVLDAVKPPNNMITQLCNVIIFSSKGHRPDPDKMSGGDLDGDIFLVIWDKKLLKFKDKLRAEHPANFDQPDVGDEKKIVRDWIQYLARWENSLLGQIDSCFYQFAKVKPMGVKSEECTKLAKLFSRVVDQLPSDIETLDKICRKCQGYTSEFSGVNLHELPIWEVMLNNQQLLTDDLKMLKECPTLEDWNLFYDKLIHSDREQIRAFFEKLQSSYSLKSEHINKGIRIWQKICTGTKLSVQLVRETNESFCEFDCVNKSCNNKHVKDSAFYRNNWTEKMKFRIKEICKEKFDELNCTKRLIEQQEALKMEGLALENDTLLQYNKEFEKMKIFLKNLEFVDELIKLWRHEEDNLQKLIEERCKYNTVIVYLISFISREYSEPQKQHERIIVQQEQKLLNIFNQCLQQRQEIDAKRFLPVDRLPNLEIREKKIKELSTLLTKQKASISKPILPLLPTNKENIEELTKTLLCQQDQLEEEIQSQTKLLTLSTQDMNSTNSEVISFKKKMKDIKMYNTYLEKQLEICNQLIVILKEHSLNLHISDDTLERFQLIVPDLCREDFMTEEKVQNIQKMVNSEQESTLMEKKNNDLERRSCKKEFLNRINEVQFLKQKINSIEEDILQKNLKIQYLQERVDNYEKMLDKVYDSEKIEKAIERYMKLSNDIQCFDLACSALINEVESRFCGEHLEFETIIKYNIQLQLCLQRESKRCEREMRGKKLPVFSKRHSIVNCLMHHDAVIIVAGTGSGKSTQVPQYLADDLHHALCKKFPKIICTQPRRVAAIRIAERVAQEYAGQIDIPLKEHESNNKSIEKMLKFSECSRKIVAYPLYSSLPHEEQDRALDMEDRVGWDTPFRKKKKGKTEPVDVPLKGTPGEVGRWVGFHIGSKNKSADERKQCKKISNDTRIHFVTDGLLLQKLRSDNIAEYDCIIIDEAHERGRDIDLLLVYLHKIAKREKPGIKVVVMSASIDEVVFSEYFGGCPIIHCDGYMHNVEIFYREVPTNSIIDNFEDRKEEKEVNSMSSNDDSDSDEEHMIEGKKIGPNAERFVKKQSSMMNKLVKHAVDVLFTEVPQREEKGDVLIFLPGRREIEDCVDMINKRAMNENFTQKHVTKVVCCTNIAETSLTIPGVKFVIDSGKMKRIIYDHTIRLSALRLKDSSKASAKQRKGRAGRVSEGVCYRLYSQHHFEQKMPDYDEPEMKQCAVDDLYLYTLSVLGCLDEIELMEDAQLALDTIQSAEERLLNFSYIETNKEAGAQSKYKVTDYGKLALEMRGELTLEAARMVIEGVHRNLISEELLNTAVIMSKCVEDDILQRTCDEKVKEQRKQYVEELGDPLTLLNIFKYFNKSSNKPKNKEKREKMIENWVEQLAVSLSMLKEVQYSTEEVYKHLEKYQKYSAPHCGKVLVKKDKVMDRSLVMNKEDILKCMVAGYFHNIVEYHSSRFMMHGYSVITPMNYGCADENEETKLLKVRIDRNSFLHTLGDTRENTTSLFTSLINVDGVGILMKNVSKILPEWIETYSSPRWQQSIGFQLTAEKKMKNIVQKKVIHNVGIQIQSYLQNETELRKNVDHLNLSNPTQKRIIQTIEEETNAIIILSFVDSNISMYGSFSEVEKCHERVKTVIAEKQDEIMKNDFKVMYPDPSQCICEIGPGFKISKFNANGLVAVHYNNWEDVQNTVVIVLNCPGDDEQEIKSHLVEVFDSVRKKISNAEVIQEPVYKEVTKKFSKIQYSSQYIANSVISHMKVHERFRKNGYIFFLDGELDMRVMDTSIYPRASEIATNYTTFSFIIKTDFFKIKKEDKTVHRKDFEKEKKQFLKDLQTEEIFGCVVMEASDFSDNIGERNFIFRQIKKCLHEETGLNVKTRSTKFPPRIEIHGEDRKVLLKNLKRRIDQMKQDIKNESNYVITYHEKIRLSTRKQFFHVLNKKNKLRKEHDNVSISILGGNENVLFTGNSYPVVQLLSDSRSAGLRAKKKIEEVLLACTENSTVDAGHLKCVGCSKNVYVQKSKKEKNKERKKLREHRKERQGRNGDKKNEMNGGEKKKRVFGENDEGLPEARRLILCGCLYCKDCLRNMLFNQLSDCEYGYVCCLMCGTMVLMKDLFLLPKKIKNEMYEMAYKNHLSFYCNEQVRSFQCIICKEWMLHKTGEQGLFRCINNKCQRLFCSICRGEVMNNVDFEQHRHRDNEIPLTEVAGYQSHSDISRTYYDSRMDIYISY